MRKTLILFGILALLLVPAAVVAQDDIAEIIELVFTDGGSKIAITDTFESVASVMVEVDGMQYLMKVPVTIDIDAMVPVTSSIMTAKTSASIGPFALDIVAMTESVDEIEVMVPGYSGETEEEYEPSVEGNKVVVIEFTTTNIGDEEETLYSSYIQGIDDIGRLFEETDLECESVNPGETGRCVIVFDIDQSLDIVGLDLELTAHRRIPIVR
jgi:hypothetical protein